MLRMIALASVVALCACDDAAFKTFGDVTSDVNEDFAIGKQLRDRCAATNNVDHCKAWIEHKRTAEAESPLMDYDKALARWEAKGPY